MPITIIKTQGAMVVRRLRRTLNVYERRYEMSTDAMVNAVRCGSMRETTEVSKWLQAQMVLARIAPTPTAGTPSKTSSLSTKHG